jgi:hypothetical protein
MKQTAEKAHLAVQRPLVQPIADGSVLLYLQTRPIYSATGRQSMSTRTRVHDSCLFLSPGVFCYLLQQREQTPDELEVAHDVRVPLQLVPFVCFGSRWGDHDARGAEEDVEFALFHGEVLGGGQWGTDAGQVEVDKVWGIGHRWLFGRETFESGIEELFVPTEDVHLCVSFQQRFLNSQSDMRPTSARQRVRELTTV